MIGHNHLGKNGRFGNQMFQYAVTRGIAAKHNYDWCIPDGPRTDDEFEDEENQHKLFICLRAIWYAPIIIMFCCNTSGCSILEHLITKSSILSQMIVTDHNVVPGGK